MWADNVKCTRQPDNYFKCPLKDGKEPKIEVSSVIGGDRTVLYNNMKLKDSDAKVKGAEKNENYQ